MSEMRLQVAKAILNAQATAAAQGRGDQWVEFCARAAIAAMREPSEAMLLMGYEAQPEATRDALLVAWQAMIDEALK
jgi:hypothetical protein